MDLYYDPATHNETRYNGVSGRGNNTGFHSGMFMPGIATSTNFAGAWRNNGSFSLISKTGLTADWYRFSMIVTSTTVVIKLLNLRTNVELTGNTVSVGTITNGDNVAFTFLSYGIDGSTGAYGSIGVNVSNITISRSGVCLLNVPLSSGTDVKVVDICNKTQYTLGFFTVSTGWAKLSDYSHANFYYGYTLYTKSGSSNLYIPNATDGTEISITPPSGYTRIGNYSNCKNTFNQCESKFKLDDVLTSSDPYNADTNHILFTDGSGVAKEFNISDIKVDVNKDRGYLYIGQTLDNNFLMYKTDKTLSKDVKILKFLGYSSKIIYSDGQVVYDEDFHAILS